MKSKKKKSTVLVARGAATPDPTDSTANSAANSAVFAQTPEQLTLDDRLQRIDASFHALSGAMRELSPSIARVTQCLGTLDETLPLLKREEELLAWEEELSDRTQALELREQRVEYAEEHSDVRKLRSRLHRVQQNLRDARSALQRTEIEYMRTFRRMQSFEAQANTLAGKLSHKFDVDGLKQDTLRALFAGKDIADTVLPELADGVPPEMIEHYATLCAPLTDIFGEDSIERIRFVPNNSQEPSLQEPSEPDEKQSIEDNELSDAFAQVQAQLGIDAANALADMLEADMQNSQPAQYGLASETPGPDQPVYEFAHDPAAKDDSATNATE